MSTQYGPISGQVLKVVHDDSNEQVNDLRRGTQSVSITAGLLQIGCNQHLFNEPLCTQVGLIEMNFSFAKDTSHRQVSHQESAEHEEADEVDVGQVAAAHALLPGLKVGLRVTASPWQRCQHDLLPLLSGCTPTGTAHTLGLRKGKKTQEGEERMGRGEAAEKRKEENRGETKSG